MDGSLLAAIGVLVLGVSIGIAVILFGISVLIVAIKKGKK